MKMSLLRAPFNTLCSGLFVWLVFPALLCSAELQVGAASVDITPNKAVALWGQFGLRLSTKPDTPLTANMVALETGDARTTFVSLDLLQLPEVFVQAISDGIVAAWKSLAPGKMAYGLDRNSIGFGRRAVYANGSAQVYGNTNRTDFVNLEGIVVLGWGAAAGDMSPRPILHKAANARMRALRGIDEMQELARRIDLSVSQTYDAVQKEKLADPLLKHVVVTLQLPLNKISEAQYQQALKARSKATQTFIVQMLGFGGYLATARAQAGGSYSAIPQSNIIGPEGGQILVYKTVENIDEL